MKLSKLVELAKTKTVSVMLDDRYPLISVVEESSTDVKFVFDADGEQYNININPTQFTTPTYNVARVRHLVDSNVYVLYFYARQPLELGS